MRAKRNAYRILVGKIGRLVYRWKAKIKICRNEIGWGCGLDLSGLG
jgi:hypothetical protein